MSPRSLPHGTPLQPENFKDSIYHRDVLQTGEVHQEYYKDSDLSIGAILNVWGRKVVLCDCDEFTREYYKTKFGVSKLLGPAAHTAT